MSDTVTNWGIGTYAFTSLVNHLNQVSFKIFEFFVKKLILSNFKQEKANLLEKLEHYEREIQVNVNKDNFAKASTALKEKFIDLDQNFIDRDFEFYFERNVRPQNFINEIFQIF